MENLKNMILKLGQGERYNLDKPIASRKIKAIIKSLPTTKCREPMQTEFKNLLEIIHRDQMHHSRDAGIVQYIEFDKCNPPY